MKICEHEFLHYTHLAYGGSCMLNVFNPTKDLKKLRRER